LNAAPASATLASGITFVTLPESEQALYRPAVGIMLLNCEGHVFVVFHAQLPGAKSEAERAVWVATST